MRDFKKQTKSTKSLPIGSIKAREHVPESVIIGSNYAPLICHPTYPAVTMPEHIGGAVETS